MTHPLLSILIPTVVGREKEIQGIGHSVIMQVKNMGIWEQFKDIRFQILPSKEVELITCKDDKTLSIGEKRELLYKQASGLYSWQIDDDDSIADNAIELILEAIKQKPDCITFRENCMMNGKYYTCNHSLKYDDWADNFDGFDFVRTPFYKDVIKTSIAQSVPFQHIRYGEDHAWSRDLKPYLKNEVHIDKEIYYYIHNSKPEEHNERYGIM